LRGQRCGAPVDPSQIVFEPVALLPFAAGGVVGVIVDVPISKRLSLGLMVVGGEKRRVCGLVDEIVFGGIRLRFILHHICSTEQCSWRLSLSTLRFVVCLPNY
jgi:hypothetical protein